MVGRHRVVDHIITQLAASGIEYFFGVDGANIEDLFDAAFLSDDITAIVSDLLHGLAHHTAGRTLEALWWWQTTYLSSWGDSGSSAQRALCSLVSHVRVGAPLEVVD